MVSTMMESLKISNCKFVGEISVLWERERDIVISIVLASFF